MAVLHAVDRLLGDTGLRRWPNQSEIRALVDGADGDTDLAATLVGDLPFLALARALDDEELLALARSMRADAPAERDASVERLLADLAADPHERTVHRRIAMMEMRLLRAGDHERLVDLYVGKVIADPSASRRAATLADLSELLERELGDPDRAFNALLAAYGEAPDRDSARELERLADITGRWTALVDALAAAAPRLRAVDQRAAWLRVAALRRDRTADLDGALAAADHALAAAPADIEALVLRAGVLRALRRWPELAATLARLGDAHASPRDRATAICERGHVLEHELHDEVAAAEQYEQALAIDPRCDDAHRALAPLLRRAERFEILARLLATRLERADAEQRLELHRELARLHEQQLGDLDEAIAHWDAVRAAAPTDIEALRALADAHERRAATSARIEALTALAGVLVDAGDRADTYFELARAWLLAGDRAKAEECLEWTLSFAPRRADAFRELAALYRGDGHWRAAIDVYSRWARAVSTEERAAVFREVAHIYERQLDDPGRAIDHYRDALALVPDDAEALSELARLHERRGQPEDAVEALTRLAEIADDATTRATALWRAGRLSDEDAAARLFEQALDAHPGHAEAATSLAAMCAVAGDRARAAQILAAAAPRAEHARARARLFTDAGAHFEEVGDDERAADAYRAALYELADHEEAAARLVDLYERRGDYAQLIALQERVAGRAAPRGVQVARWLRLARTARSIGDDPRMLRAYARVVELAPEVQEAQLAHGKHRFDERDWRAAYEALGHVAAGGDDQLPAAERVELHYRLGVCALELAERRDALDHLAAALALDPAHRPSLTARLRAQAGDTRAALDTKRALIATASPAEQAGLWAEIGDELVREVGDFDGAIEAYGAALELAPDNQRVQHRLLDVYVARRDWPAAVAALARLAEMEAVATVRARYRHAAAMIYRDELDQPGAASELLWAARREDPTLSRATEALEELLRARDDADELVRFYSSSVQEIARGRRPAPLAEQLRLWSELAELLLRDDARRGDALAAFGVTITLSPDDLGRRRRFAELCEAAGGDHVDRAIEQHRWLLAHDATCESSYAALARLLRARGRTREADACREALGALRGKIGGGAAIAHHPERALTASHWARLQHPDENTQITALLALLAPVVIHELAARQGLPEHGAALRKGSELARAVASVTARCGAANLRVHKDEQQREPTRIALREARSGIEAVIVLGAPLLEPSSAALAFELGRAVARLRPGRLLRSVLRDSAEVVRLLAAAIAVAARSAGGEPRLTPATEGIARAIERWLTPVALEQVAAIGSALLASGVDCERAAAGWWRATDLTAGRVGLAVSGELGVAVARTRSLPIEPGAALPEARAADLVRASIEDGVLAARRHLEDWDD